MSNIEKIRQEIERRKKICEGIFERESDTYYQGKAVAYGELLTFIDSLQQEKPSEALEEAAMNIYKTPFGTRAEDFIAGAAWQAKQLLKSSPLPEDTVLFQKGVEEGRRLERDDGGLAWQDIKSIVQIADKMLDDPKARVEYQNHNEEYYYKRVLNEYELHKTKAE